MHDLTEHQKSMIETWQQHAHAEFVLKDADAAVATMNANPYILGVPIGQLTQGREAVRNFYATEFLCNIPDSCKLEPIQTIVGDNHIVEEFLFGFTHDREMPWHVPGLKPTFKYCEMVMNVIIGFDGDKIAYEHLLWDHAGVLYQLGVIDHPLAAISLPSNRRIRNHTGWHVL